MIKAGEEIIAGRNEHFRVVDVVSFEEEDEAPFVGLLQVEAAYSNLHSEDARTGDDPCVSDAKPGC